MRFDNASIVVYYCLIQMNIINLGILAHIDAGKTSVTENLLFASGATEKCGCVDNGDTITDSMDIEKRRGITVRASTTSIIWNGVKCNIIDTPGHMDFIAEVERTFKMLDGAVLILSAKEGIQAQTKLLFNTLQKLQIPTIIFINKIDRAGVNLERLYLDIKANLSQDVLFMQNVVDGSVYPVCSQTYIKEEYKEFVCNHDDNILERYLADSEISPADYWNTIIALVAKAKVYPVLHGSAMFNIGINELLDAITSFILPPASVSNRLSSYLYKIEHDPKGHKRSFLKIIDGSLRLRDVVRINDSEKFIKIKNLKTINQGREINVDEVGANDIAIVEDMDDFRIGNYLGAEPCLIQGLSHQHPALKSSVRPDRPEERSKVISALNTLWIEDPSLSFSINSYSDELEISLYGLTQKEIIQTLLEERFSVKVHFDEIKTIYKERPVKKVNKIIQIEVPPNPYWATIGLTLEPLPLGSDELEISLYGLTQKEIIQTLLEERFSVKVHFDEIKTIYKERPVKKVNKIIQIEVPPNPYWATIGLTLEPLPLGTGLQIESDISYGYLNHSFQNAVFEGIRMSCQSGLHGWEVTDLKVTFTQAEYYSPVSTPADFRQLTPYVFRLALQQSGVDILEPMLYFELQIPQAASSKAITDLQKMMSEIEDISCNNEWCHIKGKVPLNTSKD
ncbi:GTP-binding protein, partial [Bacteroides sp. AM18-9]